MKNIKFLFLPVLILAVIACDGPMGMGDPVDFEPPILRITGVEVDGITTPIDYIGDKIYIGPGILYGEGAKLVGEAYDNKLVQEIVVEEIRLNIKWSTKTHGNISAKKADGWQDWSITLDGLDKGERIIEITAYDMASIAGQMNIGTETVKQLTLLVDVDPPFVDKIYIERHPGIFADLLPSSILSELKLDSSDHIDYFQNEFFTIRAEISHDFSIDSVTLNLIDENGNKIFGANGLARNMQDGTVYTPSWKLEASHFSLYTTGRHHFSVLVTARAAAGHSGTNEIENHMYNLCWWPESDNPRFFIQDAEDDSFIVELEKSFPLRVFDDDNLKEIYYTIVTQEEWDDYENGKTNEQKIQTILALPDKASFSSDLAINRFTKASARNEVLSVMSGNTAGDFCLIVLALDTTPTLTPSWSGKVFNMEVSPDPLLYCDLVAITCDKPDGAYKLADTLTFKLIFSSKVYTDGAVSIRIRGGTAGNIGGPITINMDSVTAANARVDLSYTYTIPEGLVFDPVIIESINLTNLRRQDPNYRPPRASVTDTTIADYNFQRSGLKVMSIIPRITHINGTAVSGNASTVTPSIGYDNKSLSLRFTHAVFPENGTIIVKPAADWYIPPVIPNDDFSKITNALLAKGLNADAEALQDTAKDSYYIRTTHGLKQLGGNFVPDTDTKYVLNFTSGIRNNGTGVTDGSGVPAVRTILDKAEYNWHKIDVNSVTGAGTNTITVNFDTPLSNGRLWKIEILGPSQEVKPFRDAAGNKFEGWGNTDTAPDTTHTFWSNTTETPVIRVERVSNNKSYHDANRPTRTNTTHLAANPLLDNNPDAKFQTNVRYRIDCETPGAVINFHVWNRLDFGNDPNPAAAGTNTLPIAEKRGNGRGAAIITPNMTENDLYRPRNIFGAQSSQIQDASVSELTGISSLYFYSGIGWIGDNSMYTARKDYIVAEASSTTLPVSSARGYEGAFKTLIIFRNFNSTRTNAGLNGNMNTQTNLFLRLEAANTDGGAVTIAGFPSKYNDMTGKSAYNFYRNPNPLAEAANNVDWIWISWEIVSDMWHVPIIDIDPTPFYKLNTPEATPADPYGSWNWTSEDWYVYSYRRYGDWGLRVGHTN